MPVTYRKFEKQLIGYPYKMIFTKDSAAINLGMLTIEHNELKRLETTKPIKLSCGICEINAEYFGHTVRVETPYEVFYVFLNKLPDSIKIPDK